jgi:hypothetical protein
MNNQIKTNDTKRQLALPRVVTGLRAGQLPSAHTMPPPGY